jgi:hypothetical protein
MANGEDPRRIFFHYKKGTMPNEKTMQNLEEIFLETTVATANEITSAQKRHAPEHTTKFWKEKLAILTIGGRFLACDKNQGVKFVTHDTYKRIAQRESRNYQTTLTLSVTEIITQMQLNIKHIASRVRFSLPALPVVNTTPLDIRQLQEDMRLVHNQFADFVHATASGSINSFNIPRIRMLLKVHKIIPHGALIPIRPIIPNFGLPSYQVSKWLGAFLAKMARTIPWNLENTTQFQNWITDPNRGPNVRTFDFTNLYGSEPVLETMQLFQNALLNNDWKFADKDDQLIYDAMMVPINTPDYLNLQHLLSWRTTPLFLLTAECIRSTTVQIDMGDETVILSTDTSLAMGCPPVAPISIITLAYLESLTIGRRLCKMGMLRLIDDIIVDLDIISEEQLRSCYPKYLQLNVAEFDHFLDVTFTRQVDKFVTWPYIKPYATIPLNFNSSHPPKTLRAAACNELERLISLCSEPNTRPYWVEYWFRKYTLAQYPENILTNIMKENFSGTKMHRTNKDRGVNHVEQWRGTRTTSDIQISNRTKINTSTAWKAGNTLLSTALSAHHHQHTTRTES